MVIVDHEAMMDDQKKRQHETVNNIMINN